MKLLDYLEPMKTLPNRFSNLAFWRVLRVFKDEVVEAFTYVNSWGSDIEVEQRKQNASLTEHGQKITDLVAEQVTQNNRISALEESDTSVDLRVSNLEDGQKTLNDAIEVVEKEQSVQNTNIQQLQTDVSTVNTEIETVNTDISAIKSEQETQNLNIATNRDNINAVNTNLNTLIPFVYDSSSNFAYKTVTIATAFTTDIGNGICTIAAGAINYTFPSTPFHITCRASLALYSDSSKTKTVNVLLALPYGLAVSNGTTRIVFNTALCYAPYGIANLTGYYVSYISHV